MVSTTAHALCCLAVAAAYTLPAQKIAAPRWRRTTARREIAAPRWRRTTARRAVDLSPFEEEVIRSADDQYPLTLDNVEICVEINQCVGCTRQFFTKSFLGDDAAVLARSSGEEPSSPRHRAGVASMAWRTTRRSSTNAP
jgi:hypothetical protein